MPVSCTVDIGATWEARPSVTVPTVPGIAAISSASTTVSRSPERAEVPSDVDAGDSFSPIPECRLTSFTIVSRQAS